MDDYTNNEQQMPDDNNQLGSSEASHFAQVKSRALDELMKILPDANGLTPERRFDIYLSAIRIAGNSQSAEAALGAAMAIEDRDKRATALSELIDEIEYREIQETSDRP